MYVQRSQSETALLHGERELPCTRNQIRDTGTTYSLLHGCRAAFCRLPPPRFAAGAAQVGLLLRLTRAGEADLPLQLRWTCVGRLCAVPPL